LEAKCVQGRVDERDEEIAGHVVDPMVHPDLAAGWTEAGLAGEGDAPLVATAGANVASVAGAGIAAEHHVFDGLAGVGALVWRNLMFEA
jgi:hypothetical protein